MLILSPVSSEDRQVTGHGRLLRVPVQRGLVPVPVPEYHRTFPWGRVILGGCIGRSLGSLWVTHHLRAMPHALLEKSQAVPGWT